MAHDVVIRNGNLIDGTGGTLFRGDLDGELILENDELVGAHSGRILRS